MEKFEVNTPATEKVKPEPTAEEIKYAEIKASYENKKVDVATKEYQKTKTSAVLTGAYSNAADSIIDPRSSGASSFNYSKLKS